MFWVSNVQAEKAKHDVALICTNLVTEPSETGCLGVFLSKFIHIILVTLFYPWGLYIKSTGISTPFIWCECKLKIKGLGSLMTVSNDYPAIQIVWVLFVQVLRVLPPPNTNEVNGVLSVVLTLLKNDTDCKTNNSSASLGLLIPGICPLKSW